MTPSSHAPALPHEGPEPLAKPRSLLSEWLLLAALLLLVLVDFLWPMSARVTVVVLSLLTALALPWSWVVVRSGRTEGSTQHQLKVWSFRIGIVALAAGALAAKWWLWIGTPPDELSRYAGSSRSYGVALLLISGIGLAGSGLRLARFVSLVADHPARAIALSFGVTGMLGGFLLSLPLSLQRVHELSMLDNLFTSFSAVCVTGLSVNVISQTYTPLGQGILCLLIQVGGIGIMVLSAAVAVLTGQRLRIRSSAVLAEIVDTDSLTELRRLIIAIVASTLLIEAAAMCILYLEFSSSPELMLGADVGGPPPSPLLAAVFHGVSAFCNAGFSNLDRGLTPFLSRPAVMGVITALIVLGGIGFPVLSELATRLARRLRGRRCERMSLHCRISLGATGLLLTGVAAGYLLLEWRRALGDLGPFERLVAAIFHSASSRTAGFAVVDVGALAPATLMLTMVAMFIGACPGSCGGGLKTTTVAVLFANLRSELHGSPAFLLDRTLPPATLRKAIGVSFLSLAMVLVALFTLLLVEDQPPIELAFEAFSAFSTTGLSTGVTPRLAPAGKILILLTMYVGRIGPLTLALALSRRVEPRHLQFPGERVLIG